MLPILISMSIRCNILIIHLFLTTNIYHLFSLFFKYRANPAQCTNRKQMFIFPNYIAGFPIREQKGIIVLWSAPSSRSFSNMCHVIIFEQVSRNRLFIYMYNIARVTRVDIALLFYIGFASAHCSWDNSTTNRRGGDTNDALFVQ